MGQEEQAPAAKERVRSFWQATPCGTAGVEAASRREFFERIEAERYRLEPYILDFARFDRARGKRLLEIGVGAGTDFVRWVRAGAIATGVDLTEAGVALTRERLALEGLTADVRVADAEHLPFEDASFDIVYSYGVLHCSPDTERAVAEVHRVLKPGGVALIMIYRLDSWVSSTVWVVHSLLKLRPWQSRRSAVFHHLESPGTKVYTIDEARRLFRDFASARVWPQLSFGDLLLMRPSAKYQHWLYRAGWWLYPRPLIRATGNRWGNALMIEAVK